MNPTAGGTIGTQHDHHLSQQCFVLAPIILAYITVTLRKAGRSTLPSYTQDHGVRTIEKFSFTPTCPGRCVFTLGR